MKIRIIKNTDVTVSTEGKWGPERETFTMAAPASYPTFNSITDNPTLGDERAFVRIGEINDDVTKLPTQAQITPGKRYLVYIYIHNDASATLNDAAHDHVGVAVKSRVSAFFSDTVSSDIGGMVGARITAENSEPVSVWSRVAISSNSEVHLRYVEGTAKILNDWNANKTVLPIGLFSEEGVLIGLNELNGVMPGCEEYHCVISFVLQAE